MGCSSGREVDKPERLPSFMGERRGLSDESSGKPRFAVLHTIQAAEIAVIRAILVHAISERGLSLLLR